MEQEEFIDITVFKLEDSLFEKMRNTILNEKYVSFSFFQKESVTKEILAEKLVDYFKSVDSSKGFDKIIKNYYDCIESVVEDRIEKAPKKRKKDAEPPKPCRARKYFDHLNKDDLNFQNIIDYSRIMLCLYSEVIQNNMSTISNFNYSFDCVDLKVIIESMKNEQKVIGAIKKPRFDLENKNAKMSFLMLILVYYYLKSNEVIGEY